MVALLTRSSRWLVTVGLLQLAPVLACALCNAEGP